MPDPGELVLMPEVRAVLKEVQRSFAEYAWYLVLNFVYKGFILDFKPSQFAFSYKNKLCVGFKTHVWLNINFCIDNFVVWFPYTCFLKSWFINGKEYFKDLISPSRLAFGVSHCQLMETPPAMSSRQNVHWSNHWARHDHWLCVLISFKGFIQLAEALNHFEVVFRRRQNVQDLHPLYAPIAFHEGCLVCSYWTD